MNPHFSELELAAAALSRGLASSWTWPDLVAAARLAAACLRASQPFDTQSPGELPQQEQRQQTLETPDCAADFAASPFGFSGFSPVGFSPSHFAAARVLDGAAQFAPQKTPAQSRELGLWAAAAFAQTGNFPSSTVVARRTFVRLRGHDAETSALLCAVAPVLAAQLRADSPVAAHLDRFLTSGDGADAETTLAAWHEVVLGASDRFSPTLWEIAGRGLRAALALSTSRALKSSGAWFPSHFAAQLAARVPVLLPPQAQALRDGLLSATGGALAALAPGTGKTLLGEMFLASCLGTDAEDSDDADASIDSDGAKWAVFIVPYVALGRGVVAAAKAHFGREVQIHGWLGRAGPDEDADFSRGTHLVIATPERLDAHLRRHGGSWKTLRGVVCDEAHLIGDGTRGALLEGLLTRLQIAPHCHARLLLLSAALGDYADLARWIGAQTVISSRWTPTARRLAFWRGDGGLEWHAELSEGGLQPLGTSRLAAPHPHLRATGSWPQMQRFEPLTRENVAYLTHQLFETRGGPILCLCATRRATRELALAIGEKFAVGTELSGHRARAIEAIEARHRPLLPLARWLKRGVAWHNASLPQEVRAAIEAGVAEGEIAVVAATSTLAEGVDLPFRLTVLADWLCWDEGGQRPIAPALFRNIAGRCGRAGAFTEGDTIVYDNPLGSEQFTAPDQRAALQRELYLSTDLGAARSSLEAPVAADAVPGALRDAVQGAVRCALEATLETQFLAALGEQEAASPHFVERFFASTYLARRDEAQLDLWRTRAHHWLLDWEQQGLLSRENDAIDGAITLSARGQAWRATDFSPATCRRLLGALETLPDLDFTGAGGLSRLGAHLWRALGAAPEAGAEMARFFGPRSRFVATPADLETLGAAWLRGESMEAIFAALPRVSRAGHAQLEAWVEGTQNEEEAETSPDWNAAYERWLDFGRAGLETWMPRLWHAASVLSPLAGRVAKSIDWRSGALKWSAGADSTWAARALLSGAPGTRRGVAAVGRLWPFPLGNSLGSPTADSLGLARLQRESERAQVEQAFEAALGEVGGRYCVAGRNVLELRDWVWARAGLSK